MGHVLYMYETIIMSDTRSLTYMTYPAVITIPGNMGSWSRMLYPTSQLRRSY